jgi:hypothetical protein
MTVSAAVRLMPCPPALVESRNAKMVEPGLLKRSMAACSAAKAERARGRGGESQGMASDE